MENVKRVYVLCFVVLLFYFILFYFSSVISTKKKNIKKKTLTFWLNWRQRLLGGKIG